MEGDSAAWDRDLGQSKDRQRSLWSIWANWAIIVNMKTVPAAKAKLNFGELLDSAQREPVTITKKSRPVAVMVSQAEYERLLVMEDAIWSARADRALAKGHFLSHEESMKALEDILRD